MRPPKGRDAGLTATTRSVKKSGAVEVEAGENPSRLAAQNIEPHEEAGCSQQLLPSTGSSYLLQLGALYVRILGQLDTAEAHSVSQCFIRKRKSAFGREPAGSLH